MDMGAEVMVWMGIGVIFLSLITVFVHEWDFTEDAETLENAVSDCLANPHMQSYDGFKNQIWIMFESFLI